MMNHHHAESPRTRTVALAVALARHSANGWDNPALPDDYSAIAALLIRRDEQYVGPGWHGVRRMSISSRAV